tara:strand:- start:89551 stop:90204 length:654 start_codon:yes stop_codon:yes gene_type:complete
MMAGAQLLPGLMGTAAAAFVALGAYQAVKPYAWDQLNLTGPGGFIAQAVNMLPGTPNTAADLTNFTEKSLALATIAGLGYLVSSKKALNLVDSKITNGAVMVAGLLTAGNLLLELKTYSIGNVFSNILQFDLQGAKNAFGAGNGVAGGGFGTTNNALANNAVFRGAHNGNMGLALNYKMAGAHNQLQTANTAALQRGTGRSAFFGTGGLGASRVNLF